MKTHEIPTDPSADEYDRLCGGDGDSCEPQRSSNSKAALFVVLAVIAIAAGLWLVFR